MPEPDLALISHLMRRAGFGATRAEQEALSSKDYDEIVEDLLHPDRFEDLNEDALKRYNLELTYNDSMPLWAGQWVWRMINTKRPLEEKMSLFWHHLFAAAWYKSEHTPTMLKQIQLFRRVGMTGMQTILVALAKDPAMNYWLDNCENHSDQPNENWGRELLELFSMGVGNYTEDDVRDCSRAFTGWTITPKLPRFPMGRFDWFFEYRDEDHDHDDKTFLGHTGDLNGDDIIDIIVQQPATAQFICRHLYNFFVADEPQVPAWSVTLPRDPEAVDMLAKVFVESDYDMRSVLRALFNSDFFKEARFARLKSPAEVVIGTLRMAGGADFPSPGLGNLARQTGYMGQDLMNPPSVEGWHTGSEWINSGSLMRRTNFFADLVGDVERPGIQAIIVNLKARGDLSPEQLVEGCLDLMGPLEISDDSRTELVSHATEDGPIQWGNNGNSDHRVGEMLQLIVSLRDYQFA